VDGINRNLLLGDDWLHGNGVRMYFDLGLIRIQNTYVPLIADKHINSICRLTRSITLRPNMAYVVSAKVKKGEHFSSGQECVVKPLENSIIDSQPGVELVDTVVKLNSRNNFPVEVANFTNRYIKLKKGCIICQIEQVDSKQIMTVNSPSGQNTHKINRTLTEVTTNEVLGQIHTDEEHKIN
jgi:hypothetical protein